MKLKKIRIHGFGSIRDQDFSLEPGFNLFFGGNNSGKSTIMNFILWLLYGRPGKENPDGSSDLQYAPGDGLPGGEIIYERDDGTAFSLERSSHNGDSRAVIRDLSTGAEIPGDMVPGENHLGVPQNIFEYTSLFKQPLAEPGTRKILFSGLRTILNTAREADPLRGALEEVRGKLSEYGEEKEHQLRGQVEGCREKIISLRETGNIMQTMDPAKLEEIQAVSERIKALSLEIEQIALVDEAVERDRLDKRIKQLKEVKARLDTMENRLIELSNVRGLSVEEEDRLSELLCRKEDLGNRQENLAKKLQGYEEDIRLTASEAPPDEPSMPGMVATMVNLKKELIHEKSEFVRKIYTLGMHSLDIICRGIEKEKTQTKRWFALICLCFIVCLLYGLWQEKTFFIAITTILPILLIPVYLKMKNADTVLHKLRRRHMDLERDMNRWKDKEKIQIATISTARIQELLISHRVYLQRTGSSDAAVLKKLEKEITKLKKSINTTEARIHDILVKSHAFMGNERISFEAIDAFIAGKAELFDLEINRSHDYRREMAMAEKNLEEIREEYREVCANIDSILQALELHEQDDLKDRMNLAAEKAKLEEELPLVRQSYTDLMTEEPEVLIRRFEMLSRRTGSVQIPGDEAGLAGLKENQARLGEELRQKKEEYGRLVKALKNEGPEEGHLATGELALKMAEKKHQDFHSKREALGFLGDTLQALIEETESAALTELNRNLSQTILLFLPHNRGELVVDEKYEIHYRENGSENTVPLERLGCGYLDLATLALKFSIHPLLNFRKEKLPLFLDECLAFCDDPLTSRILDYLLKISEERQVLFCTCKGREHDYLKSCADRVEGMNLIYL